MLSYRSQVPPPSHFHTEQQAIDYLMDPTGQGRYAGNYGAPGGDARESRLRPPDQTQPMYAEPPSPSSLSYAPVVNNRAMNTERPRRAAHRHEDENDVATPANKKQKTGKKNVEVYRAFDCFLKCNSSEAHIPGRKTISDYLGRNKSDTKRIPAGVMPLPCRRCYQKKSYRHKADGGVSTFQHTLMDATLRNCEKWEGNRDWKICFNKGLYNAVNESQRRNMTSSTSASQSPSSSGTSNSRSTGRRNAGRKGGKKRKAEEMDSEDDSSYEGTQGFVIDKDVIKFAESLMRKGLIDEHKKTSDCRECLELMIEFSHTHRRHRNKLPGIEFLARGDWLEFKKGEKLIKNGEDYNNELLREEEAAEAEAAETSQDTAPPSPSPSPSPSS
ncbi:MAG: hypothetical protein Q9162_004887 [Coniocarpon cinnabarinum]